MLLALLAGCLIGYAQLYRFDSELNPNVVTQPYLVNRGFVLYQQLGDQKPPLLILTVAWLMPIFDGDAVTTARTLHFVLILLVVFLAVFWVFRQAGIWASFFSGLFLIAWSNNFGLWATAYYDFLVTPFFLLFFMLLLWSNPARRYQKALLTGLVAGIAILIKQQALVLIPIYLSSLAIRLFIRRISLRNGFVSLLVFGAGFLLPILVFLIAAQIISSSLPEIVFWNFSLLFQNDFATLGAMGFPPGQFIRILMILVLVLPFTAVILNPGLGTPISRDTRIWLLVFLGAALIFQYPRYSSRHWSVVLPFAAMISGIACADILSLVRRKGWYLLMLTFLLAPAWWADRALSQYLAAWKEPRVEIVEYTNLLGLADVLQHEIPAARSMVIFPNDESNANLHYILERDPPHYFIYHYPWFMNNSQIKQKWISALEEEKTPVLIKYPLGWDVEVHAPEIIDYINRHYQVLKSIEWEGRDIQILLRIPNS